MTCELNTQKRSHDEKFSSSKHQCFDTSFSNKISDICMSQSSLQNSVLSNVIAPVDSSLKLDSTISQDPFLNKIVTCDGVKWFTSDSSAAESPKPATVMDASINLTTTCDDSENDFTSAKHLLNNFFNNFDFEKLEFIDISSHDKELEESTIISCKKESSIILPRKKNTITNNSVVFQADLGGFIFLTLKIHNRRYSIHIREFKHDATSEEEIMTTKKGIYMDINSWYEFQYKIFAFNLRYKCSSFVANNTILALNENNSIMQIKNLKNHSHIELNGYQLENLKEMSYELNKKLIHHMYTEHLPNLIRRKSAFGNVTQENELVLMSKFILSIEENVLCILNRIYECLGCVKNQPSQSLHACFTFNNREKFKQLGDMLLTLVDLDFVVSSFLNRVDCINENFLCHINVDTIRNILFATQSDFL